MTHTHTHTVDLPSLCFYLHLFSLVFLHVALCVRKMGRCTHAHVWAVCWWGFFSIGEESYKGSFLSALPPPRCSRLWVFTTGLRKRCFRLPLWILFEKICHKWVELLIVQHLSPSWIIRFGIWDGTQVVFYSLGQFDHRKHFWCVSDAHVPRACHATAVLLL